VRPLDDAREVLFFEGAALAVPLADRFADGFAEPVPEPEALPVVLGGAAATRWTPLRAGFAGVRPAAQEAPSATALVTPTMTEVAFLTS
jgi:hypothetical protein